MLLSLVILVLVCDQVDLQLLLLCLEREVGISAEIDKPDGIIGNEDVGQMSAWYVLSAVGFYPVNPANGLYVFGSPVINEATLQLQGNKKFHVLVKNNGPKNKYIQAMTLNSANYTKTYIKHTDVMADGELVITMGDKPGTVWGVGEANKAVSVLK